MFYFDFILVNYGCIFLESLFRNCVFLNPTQTQTCTTVLMQSSTTSSSNAASSANTNSSNDDDTNNGSPNNITSSIESSSNTKKTDDSNKPGLLRFNIPEHTPIIFGEVAGRTLYRLEVKDISKESEQTTLANIMPNWIIDALLGVHT